MIESEKENGSVPLSGLRLPDGTETKGDRPQRTLRVRNARMARAFDLSGKRVLDVGCAEGLHSLYMSESADEVIGIDHRKSVIGRANAAKNALNINNAHFMVGDLRDSAFFNELGHFDLVVAWGLLHRVSDPFQFFGLVSSLGDNLSLEWRTPVLPLMSRLSLAYHSVDPRMDPMNTGTESSADTAKIESTAGFWDCTPGAVRSMSKKVGFTDSQIVGYGESFRGAFTIGTALWLRHFAKIVSPRKVITQIPQARVHMLFHKDINKIKFTPPTSKDINLPRWDSAVQGRVTSTSSSP